MLENGTSDDKKYKVNTSNGSKYLICMYDSINIERVKKVAALLKILDTEGIPAQKLVDLIASESIRKVYLVLEWCDGADAFAIIPTLTKVEQYNLGVQSGRILQKIHSLQIPGQDEDVHWANKITNQTRERIQQYKESGYRFDGDEAVIQYLEENIMLVKGRPQSLRHGDYHFGNIIVSKEMSLTIIDWNSCGYGDPWEEFQQMAWFAAASPFFAIGQLHGYFNGDPPIEFFPILAFYMASCAISSIVYAGRKAKQILEYMILRGKDTVMWFECFRSLYPNWYITQERINKILLSTDTKEDTAMSIEDDVKALQEEREKKKREAEKTAAEAKRKAIEEKARRQALEKAWNESKFTSTDPVAVPCPTEYKNLIDEVYDYLRFSVPMIFGQAPDGTMRVRIVKGKETPNCSGFILEYTEENWTGGKDSQSYVVTYTMWILNNKHIYVSNQYELFDPINLRKWFVSWIADGTPKTEWEEKMEREREGEKKETIKRWKEQGLCTYCGGERSFWSGKCKQCGRG
ncbi:MAG: phosphotransferase [Candidatus Thermoplasmatota archaeon]|nr:phosphotransferase [Candidatus Thermoplasmatota archaeon]